MSDEEIPVYEFDGKQYALANDARRLLTKAAKRIEQLEAALHKINERLNDSDSWLAQSIDARNIASAALEMKDE